MKSKNKVKSSCGARKLVFCLAGFLFSSLLSLNAAVVSVGGWLVNDNSFADDANGTYSETGSWTNVGEADPWGGAGNARFTTGSGTATWTFLGLADGLYEVAASWSFGGNRPSDVPYTVQGLGPFSVNQTITASGGPTLNDGASNIPFQILTTAIVSGGTLTVVLTDDEADFPFATADAIAIRSLATPEPSTLGLVVMGAMLLARHRKKIAA